MKKCIKGISIIFACSFILMACSDDNNNAENNQNNGENNMEQDEDNNMAENNDGVGEENNESDDNDLSNENENNDESNNNSSDFEPNEEDQEGLDIGDTGSFDTVVGSYDLTLDSAELLGNEVDGVTSQRDDFILLDITVKNTGDEKQSIEELVEAMELTEDEEKSGSFDGAQVLDGYDKFEGELEPGEEDSGQFIVEVYDSETYFFRYDSGAISGGASNQAVWEFEPEE